MNESPRSISGISPILATLLLIAIVVGASIAAYAWIQTSTQSQINTASGFIIIENVRFYDINQLDLTVRNTGTSSIKIEMVYINKVAHQVDRQIDAGQSQTITLQYSWQQGTRYSIKVASSTGFYAEGKYATPSASSTTPIGWWNSNYDFRAGITVANNLPDILSSGYSVQLTVDTAALVSSGKMLPNGDDLRIVYYDGDSYTELDRDIYYMNTGSTRIWFKTQDAIPASSIDGGYTLYYGCQTAENAPANKSNVYLWFDDFDRPAKPDITTEPAYNKKTGGGTWSIENNQLKNVGASGDPNKLVITSLGTANSAVEMLVKINVESFTEGDTSRMGLSCCMDDSPPGGGYCALFHDDENSLDLLNDLRSWGTTGTYSWSLDTWYYMRFRVVDPNSRLGQVKVWSVGAVEPSSWTVDGNFGGGTARDYGEIGFAGSRTADTTYFDEILIRYVVSSEPSTVLGPEEDM
jgi:hypothetical protein